MKVGYRIEGHCINCQWDYFGRVEKNCEICGSDKLIHNYLITRFNPDVMIESIFDPRIHSVRRRRR